MMKVTNMYFLCRKQPINSVVYAAIAKEKTMHCDCDEFNSVVQYMQLL